MRLIVAVVLALVFANTSFAQCPNGKCPSANGIVKNPFAKSPFVGEIPKSGFVIPSSGKCPSGICEKGGCEGPSCKSGGCSTGNCPSVGYSYSYKQSTGRHGLFGRRR